MCKKLKKQLTIEKTLCIIQIKHRKIVHNLLQPFTLSIYSWRGIFLERGKPMSKLRGYRVMLGLTQQQMADKLKISLQSYNNKELGKTPFNDKERLAIKSMVAEIKSDITIDELFYS